MTIDLSGLQIFNNAIQNNPNLSGSTRIECEDTHEAQLGRFNIKQIPANKYIHNANNVARRNFADALTSAFGVRSLEELPKDVRDVLKIEDFKLQNGNVTSSRPLTMRRIRAVMTAIRDVTAKAAPTKREATAISAHFTEYLQRSEYMEAAFDRIAIAEGRKPLTLNIPLISKDSFEIPLSALKVYTKGIKPEELASKIDSIKLKIENDATLGMDALVKLRASKAIQPDALRANALRRYFALCAVAADETGRGISRTISIPDADGKIAAFLKASLPNTDEFETGVVHMPADPLTEGSTGVTRFMVDVGVGKSARMGEAWHVAYNAYDGLLARHEGFSPLMRRGVEPGMSIAQMYSNITAENKRLLNAYSVEMDALFKAHPNLAPSQQEDSAAPLEVATLPEPFKTNIGKILALRQTLNAFFAKLTLAKPMYADHPVIRYADETIVTADKIPAMALVSHLKPGGAAPVAATAPQTTLPYEGVTAEQLVAAFIQEAPDNKTDSAKRGWAVAKLLSELPKERRPQTEEFKAFIRGFGRAGVPPSVEAFLETLKPRELYVLDVCARSDAAITETFTEQIPSQAGKGISVYNLLMKGELPIDTPVSFLKGVYNTALMMVQPDTDFNDVHNPETFVNQRWGFNTVDLFEMTKFITACGYDVKTITNDEITKLMSLARLRDYKLEDLPAFFHRVLHKEVTAITTDDLKTLFTLYRGNKLVDPLKALKPGRTLDAISIFTGDKLPSTTDIPSKEMLRMVETLREFAKDGGVKEAVLRFNGKAVKLNQAANGLLHITVDGMRVTGAQSAAGFVNIFESDMASHVNRFGERTILQMLPELTAADFAEAPGSTSHTREICLRIVADRLEMPASAFATVPTAMLRTIATNALRGHYTTETGALNKSVAGSLLVTNKRDDVFTGEEVRELHAAMVRTNVEELNRKVVMTERPVSRPFVNPFDSKARLDAAQEKARNFLADLMMNADIVSYDEAKRNGEGNLRVLTLVKKNIETFVDILMSPKTALGGLSEPMRSVLVERFSEMTHLLPNPDEMNLVQKGMARLACKTAVMVMLDVAHLPEAERSTAIVAKIQTTPALQSLIKLKIVSETQLANAITNMVSQVDELDEAMDGIVQTTMTQVQETINEKLRANAPAEEGDVAQQEQLEIWQQSFDRLVGGALTDSSCGYGKFMNEVLSRYFAEATPQEGRQMLASLFRNTDANSTPGQVVGALFKGAGPLLQKMLQALPIDAFGPDMRDALKDMKSNLQPIPEPIVKAHLLDIVNRSNGAIKSIEVVRSLGAASVGQAFLCKMITEDYPNGEECVVKLLRPNIKTIIENERQRFVDAAKATPGMEKTFEGQYARILEELDLTKEKTNINYARNVYEQPTMIYTEGVVRTTQTVVTMNKLHSMEVHPSVPPTMDSLILKKAPGDTYDRFMSKARESAREILGGVNLMEEASFTSPGHMRIAEAKLINLYNETKTRCDFLLDLTQKWVQEALYGNGFYHGDLHAGNIMTDGKGLTVIDFGNATHLTPEERTHVLKMMAAAMYGRENYFETSFKALISEEGRAVYDSKNPNGELTKELHEILNKGTTLDSGRRIFAALMCLQRHGIEIPGPIYNFAQCQMRLGGAVDEMCKLMNEIRVSLGRLSLKPIELPEIPQETPSVAPGVRDAITALKRFLNGEGGSYRSLANDLVAHFGSRWDSNNSAFKTTRYPELVKELQTAFEDDQVLDTYLMPLIQRLDDARMCYLVGNREVELIKEQGDSLMEVLNAYLKARNEGTPEEKTAASEALAKRFINAATTYQHAMTSIAPQREANPDAAAFVYAIGHIVSTNLQPALKSLGTMAVPIFFDMLSANEKEGVMKARIEGSPAKVEAYVNACAGGAINAETVSALNRISQDFQHPLDLPGLDGKARALNGAEKRAVFLSTLKFNLNLLENELRDEGILTDDTSAEMKTHFVRIAMQFFADRVGGIADAVRRLSDANYARLYDEAYAQEVNGTGLLVRNALIHFRFPVENQAQE